MSQPLHSLNPNFVNVLYLSRKKRAWADQWKNSLLPSPLSFNLIDLISFTNINKKTKSSRPGSRRGPWGRATRWKRGRATTAFRRDRKAWICRNQCFRCGETKGSWHPHHRCRQNAHQKSISFLLRQRPTTPQTTLSLFPSSLCPGSGQYQRLFRGKGWQGRRSCFQARRFLLYHCIWGKGAAKESDPSDDWQQGAWQTSR